MSINDANVDFGRVYGDRIGGSRVENRRSIASASRTISAQCVRATKMALRFDGAPSREGWMRLGRMADYTLTVTRVTLDGKDVQVGVMESGGRHRVTAAPVRLRSDDVLFAGASDTAAAGRRLDVVVRIDAYRTEEAPLTADVTATAESRFRLVSVF
ncbi:hypothetical protein [Burkholderia metallica]|uniref:hypothetical protein n=1 Tax=Burkholderia metallica TaxID=488729 RepID=UPI001576438D|nr:hypothetical protein [Burkholderia metallica]NTZ06309.1 hypothetical protein [Burkholderia metallica]